MLNKIILFFILVLNLLILNACADLKKGLGIEKEVPNEFLIEKKESLTLPPDYKLIPPDSINNNSNANKTDDELKSIVNKNIEKENSTKIKSNKNEISEIEKEILKEIK